METPNNVNGSNKYEPRSTGGGSFWFKDEFDGAIFDRGYLCTTEKAIICPCRGKISGSALPSCQNCGGAGWVYVGKKENVKAVVQGMAYTSKYFNWTEANMATARATLWDINKLAFMDKITLQETTTIYSQNIEIQQYEGKIFAFTTYPIESIEYIFVFVNANEKLKVLEEVKDFTFEKGKNILFFPEKTLNLQNKVVSIRYNHKPSYVVFDILRDVIHNKVAERDSTEPKKENLPNSYVCRRLHFALKTDFLGKTSILENG